ncbi:MAG: response regulator [Sulfurimonas sp.]|jgi:YesN/AraC family two-component response regulator
MTFTELTPYTKNLNLLIVEDEEQIRSATVALFKRLFAVVHEAADGAQGLKIFRSNPRFYDLILTDINMPNTDGIKMIKEIRKHDALIPIVVLSAYTDFDRMLTIINAGADSFLPKPFNMKTSVSSFYRLSVRISDAKIMQQQFEQIEEENHFLNKELTILKEKNRLMYEVLKGNYSPIVKHKIMKVPISQPKPIVDNNSKYSEVTPEIVPVEEFNNQAQQIYVYDYMEPDDLEDIKENLARLNSLLLIVGGGDITSNEVAEISYYLQSIGKSTSAYHESYPISRALGSLSSIIQANNHTFIEKSSSLGSLCKFFGVDLVNWVQMIFHDGATSVDVMDDTIISNSQMLGSMLTENESVDVPVDMDDIFDF